MTPDHQVGDNPDIETGEAAAPDYETVTIQWRDLEFVIPKERSRWDMNVGFEFEDGRRLRAMCVLLAGTAKPAAVFAVRAKLYQHAKTAGELDEFLDHCAEVTRKECTGEL
jgi:hypothetical protein